MVKGEREREGGRERGRGCEERMESVRDRKREMYGGGERGGEREEGGWERRMKGGKGRGKEEARKREGRKLEG